MREVYRRCDEDESGEEEGDGRTLRATEQVERVEGERWDEKQAARWWESELGNAMQPTFASATFGVQLLFQGPKLDQPLTTPVDTPALLSSTCDTPVRLVTPARILSTSCILL